MGTRHVTKPQTRDETVMVRKGPGSMGTESHDTHSTPAQRLEPGLRRGQALSPAQGSPLHSQPLRPGSAGVESGGCVL